MCSNIYSIYSNIYKYNIKMRVADYLLLKIEGHVMLVGGYNSVQMLMFDFVMLILCILTINITAMLCPQPEPEPEQL